MKYRVLIEPDEDGVFVAEVPALPGCMSQGASREEALLPGDVTSHTQERGD